MATFMGSSSTEEMSFAVNGRPLPIEDSDQTGFIVRKIPDNADQENTKLTTKHDAKAWRILRKTFGRSRSDTSEDTVDSKDGPRLCRRKSLGSFLSAMTTKISRDCMHEKEVTTVNKPLYLGSQFHRISRPVLGDYSKDPDRRVSNFRDGLDLEIKRITGAGLVRSSPFATPRNGSRVHVLEESSKSSHKLKGNVFRQSEQLATERTECFHLPNCNCTRESVHEQNTKTLQSFVQACQKEDSVYKLCWTMGKNMEIVVDRLKPEGVVLVIPVIYGSGQKPFQYEVSQRGLFVWLSRPHPQFSKYGLYDSEKRVYFMQPVTLHIRKNKEKEPIETSHTEEEALDSFDALVKSTLDEIVMESEKPDTQHLFDELTDESIVDCVDVPQPPTEADWRMIGMEGGRADTPLAGLLEECHSSDSLGMYSFHRPVPHKKLRSIHYRPTSGKWGHSYMMDEMDMGCPSYSMGLSSCSEKREPSLSELTDFLTDEEDSDSITSSLSSDRCSSIQRHDVSEASSRKPAIPLRSKKSQFTLNKRKTSCTFDRGNTRLISSTMSSPMRNLHEELNDGHSCTSPCSCTNWRD